VDKVQPMRSIGMGGGAMLQREEYRRPRGRREASRTEQKKEESRTAGNIDRKVIEGMLKGESPKRAGG